MRRAATRSPQAPSDGESIAVSGVTITHPGRVVSELGHVTKGELAEYYAGVAPVLLPGIARRPLSLLRCPSGIDHGCFYQRNPGKGLGPDVFTFEFENKGKRFEYLYIEDATGLLELVQMGAVELHPWGAGIDSIDTPDRMIFDLDPAPDVPFENVKHAAVDLRERLRSVGLESAVKCTGGKGLHVTVPLAGKDEWPAVKAFASAVAHEMATSAPDTYTATMSKAERTGKIFIDYLRNDYTATAIADYAVRARPGAPVAMPLAWTDLPGLKSSSQFTMRDVLRFLARKPGRVPPKLRAQTLPRPASRGRPTPKRPN
jgi:bifunctional non-homologous end joining protein LigD